MESETDIDTDTKITEKKTRQEIHEEVSKLLNRPLFRVRLNYKSGHTEELAFHSFSVKGTGFNYEIPHNIICSHLEVSENILLFNASEVEAVFQVKSYSKTSDVISGEYLEQQMVKIFKDSGLLAD